MSGGAVQYLVAGSKPWNREVFDRLIVRQPGRWTFISKREELTPALLQEVRPRYIFFLHWSWMVPANIVSQYECVCFHMTDVPYGRGGSPLQNLILRGHSATKLTALRMTAELDAGPIYEKADLSLDGNAEEILTRATELAADIIAKIIATPLQPVPQQGEPVLFHRRTPPESAIPPLDSVKKLYDFIRMLDGAGYPRAFLQHAGFRFVFNRATLIDGQLTAQVQISLEENLPS
jgi:methionyl-tRNA formyltransferase